MTNNWLTPRENNGDDLTRWTLNPEGKFTVSSYKNYIASKYFPLQPINVGSLWSTYLPKKCKLFIWTLLHKGLNTGDKCQLRYPKMALSPNWCILCKMNEETAEHSLVQCSFSTAIWSSLNQATTHQRPITLEEMLYVMIRIKQNTKKKVL